MIYPVSMLALAVVLVANIAFICLDKPAEPAMVTAEPIIEMVKVEPVKAVKTVDKVSVVNEFSVINVEPAKPVKTVKQTKQVKLAKHDNLHKSVELIKNFEGFSAKAIPDTHGYQIGYGLNYINGVKVKRNQTITQKSAEYHLRKTILENRKSYANVVDPNYIHIVDSMAYQFGPGITQPNKLLGKNIRQAKFDCEVVKQYRFVGKKDCAIHEDCKGVWDRAKQTYDMCIEINIQV